MLPAELRKALGIQIGDWVTIRIEGASATLQRNPLTVESVRGSIPTPPHMVGRDLDEMINEAWANHCDEVVRRMRLGSE